MKNFTKLLALVLAFVGGGVGTAQAQVQLSGTTADNIKTNLPDGSYVYFLWTGLSDGSYTNSSTKYYFNGASAKSTSISAANYFKVIYDDNATTFKLQRATDNQYVTVATTATITANNQSRYKVSMTSTGGTSFSLTALTAQSDMTQWNVISNDGANYAKYHRLKCTIGTTTLYLNCYNASSEADFFTGTGAYSVCQVYRVPGSVTLNSANSKYYATGYYPVNMQVGDGTTAYYGTISGTTVQMTAYDNNIIPANQGALLISDENATATLTPTATTASVTGNCLIGTSTGATISTSDYVFGCPTNGTVGFYHPSSSAISLAAFKAYIASSSVSTGGEVKGLSLDLDGEATSINAVETETNSNAPIYDLSGRRVVKAAKGLYIQGGKKVFLK